MSPPSSVGRPTNAPPAGHRTAIAGGPRLSRPRPAAGRAADLRTGRLGQDRRRSCRARGRTPSGPGRPEPRRADRPARPLRARDPAPLRAPVAEEPRHRPGLYPLGSCTMKHNPRLNEKMARLPGFADIHPLQPISTVQGALALMDQLAHWLKTLTGMPAVALSPKAGAHGELCGLLAIRAAHEARAMRARRLVPDLRPRHQSRHRRPGRLSGGGDRPDRRRPRGPRRPGRQARPGRGGGDGHQPQHLRPVRARRASRSPG